MISFQTTSKPCSVLLEEWIEKLDITHFEKAQLSGELKALEKQIIRLANHHVRITVFGRAGVGKSSIADVLLGQSPQCKDCIFPICRGADSCTKPTGYRSDSRKASISTSFIRNPELSNTSISSF